MTDRKDWVEQGDRLRMARLRAGFGTKGAAAAAIGVNANSYRTHEKGIRGIDNIAKRYAEFFEVSLEWLLFGHGTIDGDASSLPSRAPKAAPMIPAASKPAASDGDSLLTRKIESFPFLVIDNFEGRALWAEQTVRLPSGIPRVTAAFKIQGDALRPVYDEGNILLYWNREVEPKRCVGADCAVCLSNGLIVLARLERGGSAETWDLLSVSAPARLYKDASIKWAAGVDVVLRNELWLLPLVPTLQPNEVKDPQVGPE